MSTKADQVEERVLSYLRNGDFKPGDTIPKEEELAQVLEVSRPVIREAMSRLRMFGMIESRKRRGAILRQPDLWGAMERVLLPNMLSEDTLTDIFELRLVLEMGMAELLYLRKSPKDLEELGAIVAEENALLKKKGEQDIIDKLIDADIAFHSKLYSISGNKALQTFQRIIVPTIRHVIDNQLKMDPLSYGRVSHGELLEILKNGDESSFRKAMRLHLELHYEKLS